MDITGADEMSDELEAISRAEIFFENSRLIRHHGSGNDKTSRKPHHIPLRFILHRDQYSHIHVNLCRLSGHFDFETVGALREWFDQYRDFPLNFWKPENMSKEIIFLERRNDNYF